jgi:hypothetical protein
VVAGIFQGRGRPNPDFVTNKKMTEETAREAVNQVRTHIDKACSVAKQQFVEETQHDEF